MNESRMSPEHRSPEDDRLDALFRAYRSACEPVEVSVNFMPELWQKIDRVQSHTFSFRRIARGFLSAATAASLVMATLVVLPAWHASPVYSATYVETLAAHSDTPDTVDVTHPDSAEDSEEI